MRKELLCLDDCKSKQALLNLFRTQGILKRKIFLIKDECWKGKLYTFTKNIIIGI